MKNIKIKKISSYPNPEIEKFSPKFSLDPLRILKALFRRDERWSNSIKNLNIVLSLIIIVFIILTLIFANQVKKLKEEKDLLQQRIQQLNQEIKDLQEFKGQLENDKIMMIKAIANYFEVNPDKLVKLAICESRIRNVNGDDGRSIGYYQIRVHLFPDIDEKCARDLVCSSVWTAKKIKAGYGKLWSCWKKI